MDFQAFVDGMHAAACVVSVEKKENGDYGKLRIVTGNRPYIDSIEKPMGNLEMLTKKFVPNSEYTNYLTRDLNFEDSCYMAAVKKKCLHAYVHPDRFDVWFNLDFLPIAYEEGNLCYCLYVMEIQFKPDAKRLSNISSDIATGVLQTCIKLRSPEDFKETMQSICEDIRSLCASEHCCVLLMNPEKRKCSALAEAYAPGSKLLPMSHYLDDKFYDIAESWEATISGSNCLIMKNAHDREVVRERNPVWYESVTSAGLSTIVLFPLKFKNELLGYVWAGNFDPDRANMIKETLELTTFILASELYSYQLMDKLHILSSTDMLTGVMNRNEMNNFVDALSDDLSDKSVGVLFADLNGLKIVNDNDGHPAGDTLLRNAADALRDVFPVHEIFRAGGDEFVVIQTNVTEEELYERVERLKIASERHAGVIFAIGSAHEAHIRDVRKALRLADERMYADKKRYYELHPEKKHR